MNIGNIDNASTYNSLCGKKKTIAIEPSFQSTSTSLGFTISKIFKDLLSNVFLTTSPFELFL